MNYIPKMNKEYKKFQFKQFNLQQNNAAMKIGTDGILLGAWSNVKNAKTALDIGTGTGVIAIMQAQKNSSLQIDAVEIEQSACLDAIYNFKQSPWSDQLKLHHLSLSEFCPNNKYDCIISNPPFFINSMKTLDLKRNIARHTNSLNYNDILEFSNNHITKKGTLSLILPEEQAANCILKATKNSLFLRKKCNVFPNPIKKQHRVLLEFSRTKKEILESNLIIETINRHEYTEEYKNLTKDFCIM